MATQKPVPPKITNKIGTADAESRLATIEYIWRINRECDVSVVVSAGGKNQIVERVYIDDLATPTRFSRELLHKTSLLLTRCVSTKDGHWPRAKWNELIADKMHVFKSFNDSSEAMNGFKTWEEFLASDKAQFRPKAD